MVTDVIIIGAGLAGAASAYALARRGLSVTSIDRLEGPGQAASFANGGMLTPSMADPWNTPGVWKDLLRWYGRDDAPMLIRTRALPGLALWGLSFLAASAPRRHEEATALNVRLASFSLEVMRAWRQSARLSYDGAEKGTVKVYRSAAALEAGLSKAAGLQQFGIDHELLSPVELARREPALRSLAPGLAGAIGFPGDEAGDAHLFTRELLREAGSLGACTLWNTEVRRILARQGVAEGVELSDGTTLRAKRIILAAGAWSPEIAGSAGLRLGIRPVKGYSITFSARRVPPEKRLSVPIVDDELHAAVTPLGDRVRVAGTAEFCGFDARPDPARLHNLRVMLRALLPDQAETLEADELNQWCGFRPMHSRGVPLIGPAGTDGLFVNTGHGHLGWTQAAGSAEALARHICGEQSAFALDPYFPASRRRG